MQEWICHWQSNQNMGLKLWTSSIVFIPFIFQTCKQQLKDCNIKLTIGGGARGQLPPSLADKGANGIKCPHFADLWNDACKHGKIGIYRGNVWNTTKKMRKICFNYFWNSSASLRPQTPYRGSTPGPHWGTSVPQIPWFCPPPIPNLLPPPMKLTSNDYDIMVTDQVYACWLLSK